MSETKFKFADGRTKLPWNDPNKTSYKELANQLKINKGMKPAEIKTVLGKPYWKTDKVGSAVKDPTDGIPYHIKAGGEKNPIIRSTLESRQRNRIDGLKIRQQDQRETTPDTKVRKSANIRKAYINKAGYEADHIATNKRVLEGERSKTNLKEVLKMRQAFKDAGLPYGHSQKNLQPLTTKENSAKETQEKHMNELFKHNAEEPKNKDTKSWKKWDKEKKAIVKKIESKFIKIRPSEMIKRELAIQALKPNGAVNNGVNGVNGVNGSTNNHLNKIAKSQVIKKGSKLLKNPAVRTAAGLGALGILGSGLEMKAAVDEQENPNTSPLNRKAADLKLISEALAVQSLGLPAAFPASLAAKGAELHLRNRDKFEKNRYNTASDRLTNMPTNLKIRKTLPQDAVRSLELK